MSHRAFLPIVAFALACSPDLGVLGPEDALGPDGPQTTAAPNPAQGGWSFNAVASYTQTVDPGETRITPGNVLHQRDLVNEFALTGDLVGWFYFDGDNHARLATGDGPVVGTAIFVLTAPAAGGFECKTHGLADGFPGPDWTLIGTFHTCVGSGAFEGQKMKGSFANIPGLPIYDFTGTIY